MRSILGLARKWLWPIIVACLLGGAAGLIVSLLQPKMYEASRTLYLVSPNRSDYNTVLGDQQAAKAFALIPQSGPVLRATLQAVGDQSLSQSQLSSMITVNNDRDSQFVVISVRDTDPRRAVRLVEEVAKQSVAQFEAAATDGGQTKQFVKQEMGELEIEIKNLEAALANTENQAQPGTLSPSQTSLVNQLNLNLSNDRTLYNQLLTSYVSLSSTQAVFLQDTQLSENTLWTGHLLAVLMGMLAGLITIVGLIIFFEQTDDILNSPKKIDQAVGLSTFITVERLPAIAQQVPLLNGHHRLTEDTQTVDLLAAEQVPSQGGDPTASEGATSRLLSGVEPAPAAVAERQTKKKAANEFQLPETFLTLGALLRGEKSQLSTHGNTIGSLLITSPECGDGKTLVASQIALGLARVGVEVVLIDADLCKPEIHTIFGLSNKMGLSTLLTESRSDASSSLIEDLTMAALQQTQEPHLSILPAGPPINSISKVLSSSRMKTILHQLSKDALVVVDSPAVLTSSAAVILADKCDGILIVVDARRTEVAKLNRSLELLKRVNANVLGAVLNQSDRQN